MSLLSFLLQLPLQALDRFGQPQLRCLVQAPLHVPLEALQPLREAALERPHLPQEHIVPLCGSSVRRAAIFAVAAIRGGGRILGDR